MVAPETGVYEPLDSKMKDAAFKLTKEPCICFATKTDK